MPTLTVAQQRVVHQLLEPRALDAAKNIFRVSLGLDPDQVGDAAMMEMCAEIAKVFYPILGRFVSGEPIAGQTALPPAPVDDSPKLATLRALVSDVLTVPEEMMPQRVRESAQRVQDWLDKA